MALSLAALQAEISEKQQLQRKRSAVFSELEALQGEASRLDDFLGESRAREGALRRKMDIPERCGGKEEEECRRQAWVFVVDSAVRALEPVPEDCPTDWMEDLEACAARSRRGCGEVLKLVAELAASVRREYEDLEAIILEAAAAPEAQGAGSEKKAEA